MRVEQAMIITLRRGLALPFLWLLWLLGLAESVDDYLTGWRGECFFEIVTLSVLQRPYGHDALSLRATLA